MAERSNRRNQGSRRDGARQGGSRSDGSRSGSSRSGASRSTDSRPGSSRTPGSRPGSSRPGKPEWRPRTERATARPARSGAEREGERTRGEDRARAPRSGGFNGEFNRDSDRGFARRERPRRSEDHEPIRQREVHQAGDDAQSYVVGRRAAIELLKDEASRAKIEKVYVAHGAQGPQIAEILHLARKNKLALGELDRVKFRELERRASGGEEAQGVIVLVAQRTYQELEDILAENPRPLLIALDGVEDPHNIGAIIRSAEACGASAVLLPKRGAVLTPAVYKTSAGAANHVAIVKYSNLDQTIRTLQQEYGVECYGLAGEGEETIYDAKLTGGVCLITGSEEKGLHRLVRERCDKLLRIPLTGKTASLNASVASAVALFEAVRQRLASNPVKLEE